MITIRKRKWINSGKRKKQGEAWQVDLAYQSPNGVRCRKRHSFAGSKPDAMKWGEDAYSALCAGRPVPPMYSTEEVKGADDFSSFSETFLATKKTENKPSEFRSKEIILKKHLIPFFGKTALADIDEQKVDGFILHLLEEKKLSRKTANNIGIVLRAMMMMAVVYGIIVKAPRIKRLKVPEPDIRAFTAMQAAELLRVIDPKWRTMLLIALRTGLRIGELRALRWMDVDLFGRKLHVRQAFARKVLGTPKSGKHRTVDLSDEAAVALGRHPRVEGSPYVFCHEDGQPYTQREVYPCLHAAIDEVRVGDASWRPGWHSARHTFISWLVQEGVPLNVVKELAGHSDIRLTLRYAHLAPNATRNAVAVLDAVTKRLAQATAQDNANTGN